MICHQREQATRGTACTVQGACGTPPDTAALQDMPVHAAQAISQYAHRLSKMGIRRNDADVFVLEALFTTVTNVNFDLARLETLLRTAATLRDDLRALLAERCPEALPGPALGVPAADLDVLIAQGRAVSIDRRIAALGADLAGLEELVIVKGKASLVSGPEEISASGGPLRRRVAAPAGRVRRLPRRHPDDHQVHPAAGAGLRRPHLHLQPRRLAGRHPHRRPRLRARHRGGACRSARWRRI